MDIFIFFSIMVSIDFCPTTPLLTSGTTLECKMFRQTLFGFPSDRHAYQLQCFLHPMRYCTLSVSCYNKKFFLKYIRQCQNCFSNQLRPSTLSDETIFEVYQVLFLVFQYIRLKNISPIIIDFSGTWTLNC